MARVRLTGPLALKEFSTLVRTAETPLSQASSLAFSGGTVVVVAAAVVVVAGAAVGLGESPPHPPASRASKVRVARRTAARPVMDGMGPSSAASRRASPQLAWNATSRLVGREALYGSGAGLLVRCAPRPTLAGQALDLMQARYGDALGWPLEQRSGGVVGQD